MFRRVLFDDMAISPTLKRPKNAVANADPNSKCSYFDLVTVGKTFKILSKSR